MSILFHNDWKNDKGELRAIPHVTTKNKSFLRTCALLKKMGIKNYAFPLALYDPDLKDVDPHDLEENTAENEILRTKVQIEARRNVWYFLRECVRIVASGGGPVPYRLDRNGCAMTWCFLNGIDYCGMAPRQTGKSVGAVSLISWIMYVSGEDFQIGHYCKDNSLREENVKRIRTVGENLPTWWLSEDKDRDKKNTTEIYYHALKTHFQTSVAQADPRKADLNARGNTQPVQWIDESDYCINIGISYPTMLASTTEARANAKANGKPYSNIITTTAGDPGNPACKESAKILDGAMPFVEQLYDVENVDKLHEIVKAASPQKMIIGIFSHLQLGRSNEWLRDLILRNRMSKEQVMRDYLMRRISKQDAPVIPAATLATINASQEEPKWIEILNDKFVIYWYVDESVVKSQAFRDRPIVLGCDSSEMIDRDATTLVGIDPRDLSVVCTFRTTEGNINTVAVMIAHLLLKYPKFLFVPENKSSGTSIIDIVALFLKDNGHNPFTRIFNWIVNNRHEEEFGKYNIRDTSLINTAAKKYFGIKTDKTKRDELYSNVLLIGVSKAASRIKDKTLIRELSSLTVRNGRVDHESGGNDDTTIAFLMAIYVILNGKHLDVYGIKPNTIMSYINPGQPDKSVLTAEKQQLLRNKIEEMEAQYKAQTDPSLCRLLQSDIKVLKSMLDKSHVPITDVSDDLYRDPKRFTDPVVSEQSKPSVSAKDLESSMRMLLGLS